MCKTWYVVWEMQQWARTLCLPSRGLQFGKSDNKLAIAVYNEEKPMAIRGRVSGEGVSNMSFATYKISGLRGGKGGRKPTLLSYFMCTSTYVVYIFVLLMHMALSYFWIFVFGPLHMLLALTGIPCQLLLNLQVFSPLRDATLCSQVSPKCFCFHRPLYIPCHTQKPESNCLFACTIICYFWDVLVYVCLGHYSTSFLSPGTVLGTELVPVSIGWVSQWVND